MFVLLGIRHDASGVPCSCYSVYTDLGWMRRMNAPVPVNENPFRKPEHERLLTPGDVARWLGVSAGWVRDHATRKQPRLPVVRLGKLMRFRDEQVEAFLKEQGIT